MEKGLNALLFWYTNTDKSNIKLILWQSKEDSEMYWWILSVYGVFKSSYYARTLEMLWNLTDTL